MHLRSENAYVLARFTGERDGGEGLLKLQVF